MPGTRDTEKLWPCWSRRAHVKNGHVFHVVLTKITKKRVGGYWGHVNNLNKEEIMQEKSGRVAGQGIMMGALTLLTVSLLGVSSGNVLAAELPREAVLPVALAAKAAQAGMEKCTADGYRVSVAVVDRAGVLRAMVREDGAGPHTVDSSRKKAYTAVSMKRPTQELAELVNKLPVIEGIRDMNDSILILGGGLPIIIDGELVGGIGVGGAPGAHLDVACAQAGLESIGAVPQVQKEK